METVANESIEQWREIIAAAVADSPKRFAHGKRCSHCGVPLHNWVKVLTCQRCRARNLTAEQRAEIARKAGLARQAKRREQEGEGSK